MYKNEMKYKNFRIKHWINKYLETNQYTVYQIEWILTCICSIGAITWQFPLANIDLCFIGVTVPTLINTEIKRE